MAKFGAASLMRLETCHPLIQLLFRQVVRDFDCTIIKGHRGKEEQNDAVRDGKSKLEWPNSKHNVQPSHAVDAGPWPLDWDDTYSFYLFAGWVLATARMLNIPIRWGGDWDSDLDIHDQNFNDLVHFELEVDKL